MVVSSLFTCTGQVFWKLASLHSSFWYILCGFMLYGCGALLMIFAFKFEFGDLSVLHPMLGIGYVFSIGLGYLVFGEPIHWKKIIGILIILLGLVQLSRSGKEM